ncbi:MAG: hypothetical protein A3K50_12430 [Planctomycetes bacterium RIFOXYD12_FULL_42_12]|nr:MAG: hypothetical protein A3J92_04055 [Planctomycetes bacterium RIFOXYC2_FULL_41_27]OHC13058.1 MAG: hypothetical protein A3K50_12430 [Planctomycetes bacterium RIFOXYD12_FULL_42_12]
MNIGKEMNFSKLRKDLTGFFTGMRGFWISIGAVFLIMLILLFVFIFPLSNKYAKTYKDLDDLTIPLENYALKVKNIYNDKWITSKKLETDLYEKELEKCKSFLKEKDNSLETVFVIDDPTKGPVRIEDEALWKNEYVKRVSGLLTKLKANNITLGEGALPFHNWGSDIPTWDAISPVQKKFWILEALVNVALNNAGITKLEKIAFRESSFTYNPSLVKLYTVIPITIQVELQADRIKFLLHEILKSDIPFVIEGINIMSTDKTFSSSSLIKNDDSMSNPIINVTLDIYIIDYIA